MPFCAKCGTEVPENASFCTKCGNALQAKAPPVHSASAQSGQPENLSLWGYYVKCLKNYANFKGRARRKEFWGFILFDTLFEVVFILFVGVFLVAILDIDDDDVEAFAIVLSTLYWLATFLPFLAVLVRRLHDTEMSQRYDEGASFAIILAIYSIISHTVLNFIDTDEIMDFFSYHPSTGVITFIVMVVLLWNLCKDSYYTENKYGHCPKVSAEKKVGDDNWLS